MTNTNDTESHGPSELCVCGDTYLRHGNGNDGGPCQVYTCERTRDGSTTYTVTYSRCDCDQFTKSEDDS